MREILFRGKHIHLFPQNEHLNGTWVYGYLCDRNYINSPGLNGELLVDPSTVGQYTGLVDKNGKRIFEGDILRYKSTDDEYGFLFVEFRNGSFCVNEHGIICDPVSEVLCLGVEVIGNIHDNPELLEEA